MIDSQKMHLINRVKNKKKRIIGAIILGLGFIFIAGIFAINAGKASIGVENVISIIGYKLGILENAGNIEKSKIAIVWNIRFPRILVAILVGSALAVSGAVFQSLLMNPLADSYTIGVSTGAAFGAVVAIYISLFISESIVPIMPFAFVGAILTLMLVIKISKKGGEISTSNLVIAGIIVSSILSSGISFIKSASGEQVSAIIYWLMGSLAARRWEHIVFSLPIIAIGIFICIYYSNDLNILCLGEKESRALGVNTKKVNIIFLITGSLLTATCVSISGIIGFIGLIVPHMIRFSLTSDNRLLIPLSGIYGGIILLVADTISRTMFQTEVPVGVLTTMLGGPFFLYIFMKRK